MCGTENMHAISETFARVDVTPAQGIAGILVINNTPM